ncbi:DUF4350 domain-containing protein [Natronolimnobius sp. AArcel1]|uniref:DUF4350 domain-containing protein n=1 Tax=Natronolimnobius sp. AArcel1 TaxID=1679093 RepID=UPI0013ED5F14|nr:DUF4350 domain-containing protein [Natronolimnobius sp. AArcel1]NGM70342.1 DUF4350 domain-containing protein [Natronolimnobius sp. AArcel1]
MSDPESLDPRSSGSETAGDADQPGFGPDFEFQLESAWSRVVVIGLALAVIATIGVGASTSTAVFGPFNTDWEGTSDLREQLEDDHHGEFELARDASAYGGYSAETVAFVVAPSQPYDDSSGEAVRRFVDRGGTLVVFENGATHGESLLEAVDATARIDGQLVRDEHRHADGPLLPTATAATDHELTDDTAKVTLNHASAIALEAETRGETDAEMGGETSAEGWDDRDGTVLLETSSFAQFESTSAALPDSKPVATVESVGDGRVVAVSDSSLVINGMVDRADNEAFVEALSADADRVVLDVSHGESLPPLASALITVRASPLLQAGVGIATILALGLSTSQRIRNAGRALQRRFVDATADADNSGVHQ